MLTMNLEDQIQTNGNAHIWATVWTLDWLWVGDPGLNSQYKTLIAVKAKPNKISLYQSKNRIGNQL